MFLSKTYSAADRYFLEKLIYILIVRTSDPVISLLQNGGIFTVLPFLNSFNYNYGNDLATSWIYNVYKRDFWVIEIKVTVKM